MRASFAGAANTAVQMKHPQGTFSNGVVTSKERIGCYLPRDERTSAYSRFNYFAPESAAKTELTSRHSRHVSGCPVCTGPKVYSTNGAGPVIPAIVGGVVQRAFSNELCRCSREMKPLSCDHDDDAL